MSPSGWNSRFRVLLLPFWLLLQTGVAAALSDTGTDSLSFLATRTPADNRARLALSYSDTTIFGISYRLLENYTRFHNFTSANLKQENQQQLTLTRPLLPVLELLVREQSEFFLEREGRRLFDGMLLGGGRLRWGRQEVSLGGGAVSRLRDERHDYGPAVQLEATQRGQLNSKLSLLMENPGGYRERKALLTSSGTFELNDRVQDRLQLMLDYDQSTQDWIAGLSQRKSLQEQAMNSLAYRVNSHTTVLAVTTLQFNRLEQGNDNHRRLGWEQQFRHHYLYGGWRLQTSFSLQRYTAEAELNQERRFSDMARNLLRLESSLPLWSGDTLLISGMIDRLRHDTDLYGSGTFQNEVTDRDYRDERLLRGSIRYRHYQQTWRNEFSLLFRSRELNYLYAAKSGNNHTAVNLVLGEQVRFYPWSRWELRAGVEMLSAWRQYQYEEEPDLRSHIERGFRAAQGISFLPGAGDTLQLDLSVSYEDGGLYSYENHIEYRSYSADENSLVLSWSHLLPRSWLCRTRLHLLQRHDWNYDGAEVDDRSLRRRLQQLNGRVEVASRRGFTLQTGMVYSWGENVSTRLDWVYLLNWRISF